MLPAVNITELRSKVQDVYKQVAQSPQGEFHFEMGRHLAEKLGYAPKDLDRIPAEAIASFAGVGYHFDLAGLREGETVLDLGSGSGMDTFVAALKVGPVGQVVGVDMTDAQLEKAETLGRRHGFTNLAYRKGYIEEIPLEDAIVDAVISNGVINLCAEKDRVFQEIARVLKPGGRVAISDIVTEKQLTETITCNTSLWAACIGGAAQQDNYRSMIERAELVISTVRDNPQYAFLSKSAQGASRQFGVKSISLLAKKKLA
jgi:arsenite methyltransferase